MSDVLHVAGIDESAPHIDAQLVDSAEHPGDAATCSHTAAQSACAVVASTGTSGRTTSGCVGTSGEIVTSGVIVTSGGTTASIGVEASGRGAVVMHEMSAVCCDMQSVKLGVSPEQTIADEPAHEVNADACEAHAALLTSAAQPVTQDAMSPEQPEVAATRAQRDVHAPVMVVV